jgi:hypothetical protein
MIEPILAILSCHAERHLHDQIRATWLKNSVMNARFFLGAPVLEDTADEVFLDVPDDYNSVWQKVRAAVAWAFRLNYTHLFKTDTDTYVHIPRLLASGFENHDYLGCSRDWWDLYQGVFRNKWPCYGGVGYWLSRKAMAIILTDGASEAIGRGQGEDWWVYETLKRHGIEPHHDERYHGGIREPHGGIRGPMPENDFITCHHDNRDWLGRTPRDPKVLMEIHEKASRIT